MELLNVPGRERVLEAKLQEASDYLDYCLIRGGPPLGLLTVRALTAADAVFLPIQMSCFALGGVEQLMAIIRLAKEQLGCDKLDVTGVMATFCHRRSQLARQVEKRMGDRFGNRVFDLVLTRTA